MNKSRKFAALITITIILLTFWGIAGAQVADDDPEGLYLEKPRLFYAGLIGGANFAQVDGDNFAGYHKVGANVGGIGYVQVYKHTAVSWEILYTEKGAKSNFPRPSGIDSIYILKYNINARYAEIPLMINYFDQRKSHFGVGVSYSRLITATEGLKTDRPYAIDLTKYPFVKNNFDIVAGAQLHLVKGLFMNFRFQYSLNPIRTDSPPNFSRAQKQYSNVWTVRLMYLFI
ncbi:MAG: hypothetical protein JWQ38_3611 [Flavipsychrobacter sp.]|nr:hypothetical protein [Flavipsychrobacter sp.]